jgi:hypothetical protein
MPTDQRHDDADSIVYDYPAFGERTEILGEPEAVLYVSSTATLAYFAVRLCDVAPDGTSRLISYGGLLSSLRHRDDANDPLVPGEVAEIRFRLKHCAYAIAPGHRLRVAVSSALFQNAWPTGQSARNTIHRGPDRPSRVVVPMFASVAGGVDEPTFEPSPFQQTALGKFPVPTYTLHRDFVNDTVTCELGMMIGDAGSRTDGYNRSKYTVSNQRPAFTTIESSFTCSQPHPTLDIRIDSTCQTTSNETSYSHGTQLQIRINGGIHFEKSWLESVPREGS